MDRKVVFENSGPQLKEPDLDRIERLLAIKLPSSVRKFYLQTNGGVPDKNFIYLDDDLFFIVNEIFKLDGPSSVTSYFKSLEQFPDTRWFPEGLVQFGTDPGGSDICFSIRSCDNGVIFLIDAYHLEDAPILLANSMDEFIDKLEAERLT
jgi:SMI1 / KNR4 family (SUKH-1)